jgi:PQ loop repeat
MGICSIFLKNYRRQDTSGLSIYFLVQWCVGGSMNLISAMLAIDIEVGSAPLENQQKYAGILDNTVVGGLVTG